MGTNSIWLVELKFRSRQGWLVRHFYVVPEAADAELARRAALLGACTPGERALRGGADIEEDTAKTHRVICDHIGNWSLAPDGDPSFDNPSALSAVV